MSPHSAHRLNRLGHRAPCQTIGSSGCGITTTLNMVVGLKEITYGKLWFDGSRRKKRAARCRRPKSREETPNEGHDSYTGGRREVLERFCRQLLTPAGLARLTAVDPEVGDSFLAPLSPHTGHDCRKPYPATQIET
jgi:energy-coupling factor transporter ATP-binding protein EcfA2